ARTGQVLRHDRVKEAGCDSALDDDPAEARAGGRLFVVVERVPVARQLGEELDVALADRPRARRLLADLPRHARVRHVSRPSSPALWAASTRERQESFRRMFRTCMSTVLGLRKRRLAISRLVWPTATSRITSSSRPERPPPLASAAARRPRRFT